MSRSLMPTSPKARKTLGPLQTSQNDDALNQLSETVLTYMQNFLSPHTRSAYEVDFREFGKFLKSTHRSISHPKEITKKDVIDYREYLRERFSPTTINRKLSALSSLFSELQNAQVVVGNPTEGVKRPPPIVKRERLGFSDKETNLILDSFDEETLQGLCDKTVLTFLFYTGARISEAVQVKLSDLDDIDGIAVVHLRGKGDKLRTIPLHTKLNAILRRLMARRNLKRGDHLFTRVRGRATGHLTRHAVALLLKKTLKSLGMGSSRSPHASRRTVISNLLQSGSKLESVATLVGHSSVNTTLRYKVRDEKLEDNPLLTLKYKT